jgi:hypothetical protein
MPHADDNRLRHHAPAGEHGNPLVGRQINPRRLAEGGIEDGVAVMENDKREAVTGIARVGGREPDAASP